MVQMLFVLLFSYALLAEGFLLNSPNQQGPTGSTGSNQQYVTVSDFLDAKKEQQKGSELLYHEIEQLRHDTDKTLNVLTSQIRDKLDAFEQKMPKTTCCNESKTLEQNYNELVRNHSVLSQEYENLQANFLKQKLELERIRNKTIDLEFFQRNDFNQTIRSLQSNVTTQQQELINIRNTTNELHSEIQNLNQLKNIKPIQDIQGLQLEVKSISTLTHNLKVNEQARTQDFLALYNVTVQSKQSITELEKKREHDIAELRRNDNKTSEFIHNQLKTFESNQRMVLGYLNQTIHNQSAMCRQTINAVRNEMNLTTGVLSKRIEKLGNISNSTLLLVQEQGNKINEKVALTTCSSSTTSLSEGSILKFPDIRSQVGVHNISSLASSGKFTCETEGLYLVSAWALSDLSFSEFEVVKDSLPLARAFITYKTSQPDTATAVVAIELQPGDKVWIQTTYASRIWHYNGLETCLTILKVK